MYGTETFPEMRARGAHRRSHPRRHQAVPGAEHTWQPEPMAAELSTFVKSCQQPSPALAVTPVRRYSTVPWQDGLRWCIWACDGDYARAATGSSVSWRISPATSTMHQ